MKKIWVVVITVLYITGCASPSPIHTAIPLPSPSPLPTSTLTPVPTETPQPTQTPVVEKDLSPIYTENISQEFMGVHVTSSLITDESLSVSNPRITKIAINPEYANSRGEKSEIAIAHFMARTVFEVWWRNGEIHQTGTPTEDDFKAFMEAWSIAQKENDLELWKKLGFSIFANDLNTQGYEQKKVTIWPMYTGIEVPDGVTAIKEISVVFVRGPRMENIILYSNTGEIYGDGIGVNIDENNLYIYVALGFGYNNPANAVDKIVGSIAEIPLFLVKNKGSAIDRGMVVDRDDHFTDILLTGRQRGVIKVYPPRTY